MTGARILVAGIGNIFLGDDGFGVEVVRAFAERPVPEGVCVVDFGIRGFDLAYAMQDGYETVILVDAAPRGGVPGTLYLIEPDRPVSDETEPSDRLLETHAVNPTNVFRAVAALGGVVRRCLLLGCEPTMLGADEEPIAGLSIPVQSAVDEAVRMLETLCTRFLDS